MAKPPKNRSHGIRQQNGRLMAVRSLIPWITSHQIEFLPRDEFNHHSDFTFYRHLVNHVIRHKSKLAFYIRALTGKPLKKMDAEVVACLMVGLTQLEPDSKVEAYAAINETVELLRLLKKPYLKGFVNANLRRFSREKQQLALELAEQPLAIQSSHAPEFIKRWENHFGSQTTAGICRSNNVLPEIQLVINPRFNLQEVSAGLEQEGYNLSEIHRNGFTVQNPSGLFESQWSRKGAFLVQDRSFQNLNHFLNHLPKSSVLDLCSAPGGKLIHFEWSFAREIETLIGCELKQHRLKRLKANIRHFNSDAFLIRSDAFSPPFKRHFDLVILDAPCSGTGTIRKHPEIKWSRSQNDLKTNHKAQLAMLNRCCDLIKPGGHVLYSTCSLEFEENQAVVKQLIRDQPKEFQIVPLDGMLEPPSLITTEGYYQSLPTSTRMGCFAALLKRRSSPLKPG